MPLEEIMYLTYDCKSCGKEDKTPRESLPERCKNCGSLFIVRIAHPSNVKLSV